MKNLKNFLLIFVLAAITLISNYANAGLMGSDVTATENGASYLTQVQTTVANGAEFTAIDGYMSFDFSDSQLIIQFPSSTDSYSAFNFPENYSIIFEFTNLSTPITGISVSSNTGFSGNLVSSELALNTNPCEIILDFSNVSLAAPASLTFSISTQSSGNAIPEPFVLYLTAIGLLALSMASRRKAGKP
jgi:hypothetical protein